MGIITNLTGSSSSFDTFVTDGTWVAPDGVTRVKVTGSSIRSPIFAGYRNSGRINNSNFVYTCGYGSSGSIGNGTTNSVSSAVLVSGSNQYRLVSYGIDVGLGLTTFNDLYAWGGNINGVQGTGIPPTTTPYIVHGGRKYVSVAAGYYNSGAVDESGTCYTWGGGNFGQLGNSTVGVTYSTPVQVSGSVKFKSIKGGYFIMGGLNSGGDLYMWGRNVDNQIYGHSGNASSPSLISYNSLKWIDFSTTNNSTYAISTDGTLYGWGSPIGIIPNVVSPGLKFRKVSSGYDFTAAISVSGDLYTWGLNTHGQLGNNTTTSVSSPTAISPGVKFSEVACGHDFAVALSANGSVYSWGRNASGQLDQGDVISRSSPTLIANSKLTINSMSELYTNEIYCDVVPGDSYSVSFKNGFATFGIQVISAVGGKLSIEY